MSWKDNLVDASFRGVPFFVDISTFNTGRRAVAHEFVERDAHKTEDTGKRSDSFQIEGHILGDNYFETKQAIIDACNKKGPGILSHPYYGLKNVQCMGLAVKEDTKEGRIAYLTFTFSDALPL